MEKEVYFIRHNFLQYCKTEDERKNNFAQRAFDKKRICFGHFPVSYKDYKKYDNDNDSLINLAKKYYKDNEPKLLENANEKSLKNMLNIQKTFENIIKNKNNILIVAEYELLVDDVQVKKILIGEIDSDEIKDVEDNMFPMKYLTIKNVKEIFYEDYPALLSARPPYNTICRPKSPIYNTIIPLIYKGEQIDLSIDLMHYKAVEQMCEEYLRLNWFKDKKYEYSNVRVGKSLAIYDIIGRFSDGCYLYAQVKFDGNSGYTNIFNGSPKSDDKIYILFSRDSSKQMEGKNCFHVSIEDVFNKFKQEKKEFLEDLIGLKYNIKHNDVCFCSSQSNDNNDNI